MRAKLASLGVLITMITASAAPAQPSADSRLMFDPGALSTEPTSRTPNVPAATPPGKRNAATATRKPETAGQPWLLDPVDGAAAGRRVRMKTPDPVTETKPGLGRVPFEAGSFGLETDTQLKAHQFPDGRNMVDKAVKSANSPSYFGLSVTVPTDSKTLPFLPRPD